MSSPYKYKAVSMGKGSFKTDGNPTVMLLERHPDFPAHTRTYHGVVIEGGKARLNDGRVVKFETH